MLTEQQRKNIHSLDTQTCIEVMRECANRVGLVDMEEAEKIFAVKKRAIYNQMTSGKLNSFAIGKHKYPCINT